MNYTVKEVANKLRVSEGLVYDLVKKGTLKKEEGICRVIRISSNSLKSMNRTFEKNFFQYNPSKVKVFETSLGKIRNIKNSDKYVLVDIIKTLGMNSSNSIAKAIDGKHLLKLSTEEAKSYGFFSNQFGILLISYEGIKEYSTKSRNQSKVDILLKELKIEETQIQQTIDFKEEEIVHKDNGLQIVEQRELLGKHFKMYGNFENPLFLARDVAEWIEHSNSSKMIKDAELAENEIVKRQISTLTNSYSALFVTEDGLYEILMQSRKPIAKEFKKQVKVILKQIRLTGGYVDNTPKFINSYFYNFSKELRKEMALELESKAYSIYEEKQKLDKQYSESMGLLNELQGTLR